MRPSSALPLRRKLLKQPVWYKLYRTDLIRDIPFAVGKYHEDVFWSWQAVARAKKVSIFDTPCYFYLQRGGSIMGAGFSLKRLWAALAAYPLTAADRFRLPLKQRVWTGMHFEFACKLRNTLKIGL